MSKHRITKFGLIFGLYMAAFTVNLYWVATQIPFFNPTGEQFPLYIYVIIAIVSFIWFGLIPKYED